MSPVTLFESFNALDMALLWLCLSLGGLVMLGVAFSALCEWLSTLDACPPVAAPRGATRINRSAAGEPEPAQRSVKVWRPAARKGGRE